MRQPVADTARALSATSQAESPVRCHGCDRMIQPAPLLHNRAGWHIVRCPECQLTFVHPQPAAETISAYYTGLYASSAEAYDEKKMIAIRRSAGAYADAVARFRPVQKGTSLLDLGAGLGYYSKAFAEIGLSVTSVEQDSVSARFARSTLGVPHLIEAGEDAFFSQNTKKFDIVFLRHVIEHAPDPDKLIRNVQGCLVEGGVLIVETDNNAGIELLFHPGTAKFYLDLYRPYVPGSYFSLLRTRPFAVDPPRHLFGFRKDNLTALLLRHSLVAAQTHCYRLGHPVYWPTVDLPALSDIGSNTVRLRVRKLIGNVLDIGLWPVRLLLERLGMASGICIYAVKKQAGSRSASR